MFEQSLSSALFTLSQQKVLGLLYGKPGQSFYANEVCRIAGIGKGVVMGELKRLHKAGVISLMKKVNQSHYQADTTCPIYLELLKILSGQAD